MIHIIIKRNATLIFIVFLALILNSCIKVEDEKEFRIVKNCNNLICHVEFKQVDVRLTTDIIGRQSTQIVRETRLRNSASNIVWEAPGARSALSSEMVVANLPACETDQCSVNDNPTGFVFPKVGSFNIRITGSITLPNGDVKQIDESDDITIEDDTFLTQIVYKAPRDSNKSATEIANLFSSAAFQGNVAQVIGNDGDNTLTFVCKPGYFIDPDAEEVSVGSVGVLGSWEQITPERTAPIFRGSSDTWGAVNLIGSANDSQGTIAGTAINCGLPV